MKKIILIVGIILAAAALSGGSFWGGMKYQTLLDEQAQAAFFEARGGQFPSNGQFPGNGQMPDFSQLPANGQLSGERQAMGSMGDGMATGQIKSIEGSVLMLSTAQDVTTINLSFCMDIPATTETGLSDLLPGMRVRVTGERGEDGSLNASQILVVDPGAPGVNSPSATGTAP
ncbi:MAG: hypothetical protein EHM70_21160 [Chloroflexota bacterium]|nr:MAG: hypothetical protein EHM70_21160 [Chloroflexota bacterium]